MKTEKSWYAGDPRFRNVSGRARYETTRTTTTTDVVTTVQSSAATAVMAAAVLAQRFIGRTDKGILGFANRRDVVEKKNLGPIYCGG